MIVLTSIFLSLTLLYLNIKLKLFIKAILNKNGINPYFLNTNNSDIVRIYFYFT